MPRRKKRRTVWMFWSTLGLLPSEYGVFTSKAEALKFWSARMREVRQTGHYDTEIESGPGWRHAVYSDYEDHLIEVEVSKVVG